MRVAIVGFILCVGIASGQYRHPSQGRDFTLTTPQCPPCDCATTTTTTTTTTRPTTTRTTTRPTTTRTTTRPTTTRTTTTTRPTTTTTPTTTIGDEPVTTTPPCATPPTSPPRYCPDCVMAKCTPNACNQGVQVPYPGDCTKFCKCELDGAKEFLCPGGLEFNEGLQVCDWPSTAACTIPGTYLGGCEGLAP
ncbi:Hypothetical predicted protein [Cloeon dipterum]|uniref:Chitin-binding type-2 domain-containing protein n=1 Tax=Cloeon dipterum TaxID=197152 RepID=A0A8S1DQN5_9INSE|nr:Hypothetical predicted protein [Cloeon dipterum]